MRTLSTALALIAVLATFGVAPGVASAQNTPPPLPPKPDFSPLRFLVGTWSCRWRNSRRPADATGKSTYALDPSGYWLDETSVEDRTAWYPYSVTTYDRYTYDPDTKRWVDISTDETGGYSVSTSSGPKGDSWVWHDLGLSPPGGDMATFSDVTVTRNTDAKYSWSTSYTMKDGKSFTFAGICTKQ